VPLTFMTADRTFENDEPLPHDDHEHWRRPYRPGPHRVGVAALLLLLASFVLFAAVIIAFTGGFGQGATVFGLAALVIAAALRLLRMGVWVSAQGLRRVAFLTTTTLRWQRVASVRTVQQPVRWLGLPRTVQGQALVLSRADRSGDGPVELMTTHTMDFLGRPEAFDRAADSVEAWAAEYRSARR
jgi:hypothetical protein